MKVKRLRSLQERVEYDGKKSHIDLGSTSY